MANTPPDETTATEAVAETNPHLDTIRVLMQVRSTDVSTGSDGKKKTVRMSPMGDLAGTNEGLSSKTNFGVIELVIDNEERFDYFENGREFYVDLIPVESVTVEAVTE